jgi:hypothetical protein
VDTLVSLFPPHFRGNNYTDCLFTVMLAIYLSYNLYYVEVHSFYSQFYHGTILNFVKDLSQICHFLSNLINLGHFPPLYIGDIG